MVASAVAPESGDAPTPAPLLDWGETWRFLRAIGRVGDEASTERIVLALFPETQQAPCIHYACTADALPKRSVAKALMRPKEPGQCLALGMVVNAPAPVPADWGTKPEHFGGGTGTPEERRKEQEILCRDWNANFLPPGSKHPRCWGGIERSHRPRGGWLRRV